MGKAILFAAVSLDGFVADEHDQVGPLFDWYDNGDVAGTFSDEERVFHTTAATAEFLQEMAPRMATMVCGRRLFDLTNGWGGRPPNGEHVFVVTHRPPTDWPWAGAGGGGGAFPLRRQRPRRGRAGPRLRPRPRRLRRGGGRRRPGAARGTDR